MVVGWILVTHNGYGGLRSCEHRHGGCRGVNNGVKRGSEADCYLKGTRMVLGGSGKVSFGRRIREGPLSPYSE